jgi:hypothetical protein
MDILGQMDQIKTLLTDELFGSKDWRDANTAERVEMLIEMVESKNREIELWLEQIEYAKSEAAELVQTYLMEK